MILDVLRTPGSEVSRLIWIYAGGMLGFMSMTAVLALYLASDFGVTEESIFIFFVYLGGIGVIMRAVLLGKLVDWLGEVRLMRVGALLLALGLCAIPLPGSVVGPVQALSAKRAGAPATYGWRNSLGWCRSAPRVCSRRSPP